MAAFEWLFLTFTPYLLLADSLLAVVLVVLRKTRPLGKKLTAALVIGGFIYVLIFSGGDLCREFTAKSIIRQTQPVISALEQFRRQTGSYPSSLDVLMPAYLQILPSPKILQMRGKTYPAYIYESNGQTYHLRFWLDGLPFGHHFIYTPSKSYPDWLDAGPFQLKKRIGEWGWYLKV